MQKGLEIHGTLSLARHHVKPVAPSVSPRREAGTPSRWDQYRELVVSKRVPLQA